MGDSRRSGTEAAGAGGAGKGDVSIPASEEGTGIVPEDEGSGEGPEEGARPREEKDERPVQSWPGKGGPGTIPPPG